MKTEINNKQINVWLPKKLFKDLKKKIDGYNRKKKKPKLNLAIAAYLLNLVIFYKALLNTASHGSSNKVVYEYRPFNI